MFGRKKKEAAQQLPAQIDDDPGAAAHILTRVIESGTRVQAPAIRGYVARMREKYPDATPAQIVTKLEKHYLAAVMAGGAAVGAAALVPGVGTLIALSLIAGETALFLETTALFILAVAEVYGINTHDRERRRAVVLGTLAGEDGQRVVSQMLGRGRTSGAWLADGTATVPLPALGQLNTKLMKFFVKKFAVKRSALIVGKLLPVGLGALIGAVGNRLMGRKIVNNARLAFGPAPDRWTVGLHVLPDVIDAEGA